MDKWIEAIANGDFSAILSLLTTLLSGGFGTALVVLASKFLKYKSSVESVVNKAQEKLVPEFKKIANDVKVEIVEEVRKDIKVIAESIALGTNNDPDSKIAVINNVSKIGVSKQVQEQAIKVVEEEVAVKEEKQEKLNNAINKLESNTIETL